MVAILVFVLIKNASNNKNYSNGKSNAENNCFYALKKTTVK